MTYVPTVFISHSHTDADFAHQIGQWLEEAGFNYWIDVQGIPDGSSWQQEIEEAIRETNAVVVIWSQSAKQSRWVENEILLADDLHKPIFVAKTDEAALPLVLRRLQYSDFRFDRVRARKKLIESLQLRLLPEPTIANIHPDVRQHKFFEYVGKRENGERIAEVARRLYGWALAQGVIATFRGHENPAFHVEMGLGAGGLTLFSLRTYDVEPAVEIALKTYAKFPPFDDSDVRLELLKRINRTMPAMQQFEPARIDGRPQLPISVAFATDAQVDYFLNLMGEVLIQLQLAERALPDEKRGEPLWFHLRNSQIAFTANFANDLKCNWQGVGGVILGPSGEPLTGVRVRVFNEDGFDRYAESGSSPSYGYGGWDIQVDTHPNNYTYFVEIYLSDGTIASPTYQVTFPNHCDANLAIFNFEPLEMPG